MSMMLGVAIPADSFAVTFHAKRIWIVTVGQHSRNDPEWSWVQLIVDLVSTLVVVLIAASKFG